MDRALTDKEKDKNEIKTKRHRPQSNGLIKVSYLYIIKRVLLLLFLLTPWFVSLWEAKPSETLRWDESRGIAPSPVEYPEAVLQIYAARTWGIKGMFAVHSWIAMKPKAAKNYEVSQVIGWRHGANGNVLWRENIVPDRSWYGNEPTLLLDLRGERAESIIKKVDEAIQEYPWSNEYQIYPGPNSNTFIAWLGLKVPELGLDLPSTAIGKDWRPWNASLGSSASGSGLQASLLGLLGASVGYEEGVELNILGLNIELDLFDLSLELPFFGRFETWYVLPYLIIWLVIRQRLNKVKPKYIQL